MGVVRGVSTGCSPGSVVGVLSVNWMWPGLSVNWVRFRLWECQLDAARVGCKCQLGVAKILGVSTGYERRMVGCKDYNCIES